MNIGTKGDIFVLSEEQRHILMDYNRQWLLDHRQVPEEPPAERGVGPEMGQAAPTTYDPPDPPAK